MAPTQTPVSLGAFFQGPYQQANRRCSPFALIFWLLVFVDPEPYLPCSVSPPLPVTAVDGDGSMGAQVGDGSIALLRVGVVCNGCWPWANFRYGM